MFVWFSVTCNVNTDGVSQEGIITVRDSALLTQKPGKWRIVPGVSLSRVTQSVAKLGPEVYTTIIVLLVKKLSYGVATVGCYHKSTSYSYGLVVMTAWQSHSMDTPVIKRAHFTVTDWLSWQHDNHTIWTPHVTISGIIPWFPLPLFRPSAHRNV